MIESTLPLPGLSPVSDKTIVARFDGGQLSSDGGLLVLREVERRLGVADRLAACIDDPRDPDLITHSLADIIRVTDGPIALTPCASRTEFAPCKDCEDVKKCALRHVMLRVRDAAAGVLEGTSVNDLLVLGLEKDENST